jgi:hypothetical protein
MRASSSILLLSCASVLACACAGAQSGPPTAEAQATETPSPPVSSKLLPTMTQAMAEPTRPTAGMNIIRLAELPSGRYLAFTAILAPETAPDSEPAPALFLATERGEEWVGRIAEGDLIRPQLSPDPRWLAFEALRQGAAGPPSIGILDTASGDVQWPEAGQACAFASWSPDSTRLALSCDLDIYILDPQAGERVLIADCSGDDNACTDPVWSPAGNALLVYRAMEFRPDPGIYHLSTDCLNDPTACPTAPEFFLRGLPELAWSRRGDRIAFLTFDGDLGIASADGTLLETHPIPQRAQVMSMAWSEEGDVLALTLDTYSNGQDAYLVSFPDARWKQLSLAEGDSQIEFWVSVP